ncbi:uncharacterized protein [Procambarus clarkii]|uniref:uncharacterized protein n=1 Tax=Procambarus clarkii TaxID=6728 RepID=UPI0037440A3B
MKSIYLLMFCVFLVNAKPDRRVRSGSGPAGKQLSGSNGAPSDGAPVNPKHHSAGLNSWETLNDWSGPFPNSHGSFEDSHGSFHDSHGSFHDSHDFPGIVVPKKCRRSEECAEHLGKCRKNQCRRTEVWHRHGCRGGGCRCCIPLIRQAAANVTASNSANDADSKTANGTASNSASNSANDSANDTDSKTANETTSETDSKTTNVTANEISKLVNKDQVKEELVLQEKGEGDKEKEETEENQGADQEEE